MSAMDLLRRLYQHGVDVSLNAEGGVRVTRTPPPAELVAELKANRDDVVGLLRHHHVGERDDGYPSDMPRRYVVPGDCLTSRLCSRIGPCSCWLMHRPCDDPNGSP